VWGREEEEEEASITKQERIEEKEKSLGNKAASQSTENMPHSGFSLSLCLPSPSFIIIITRHHRQHQQTLKKTGWMDR